jgi:hypothetical protein
MTLVSIREIIDDYNVALATPVKKSFINEVSQLFGVNRVSSLLVNSL